MSFIKKFETADKKKKAKKSTKNIIYFLGIFFEKKRKFYGKN